MKIKTTLQISNDNADVIADMHEYGGLIEKYEGEFDETIFKKWVAVDDLNNEKIMSILEKVFEKAECCQEDTLWYDDNTTLAEMIVIQFEKELKGQ